MQNKCIKVMVMAVVSSLLFTLYAMEGGGRIPIEFLINDGKMGAEEVEDREIVEVKWNLSSNNNPKAFVPAVSPQLDYASSNPFVDAEKDFLFFVDQADEEKNSSQRKIHTIICPHCKITFRNRGKKSVLKNNLKRHFCRHIIEEDQEVFNLYRQLCDTAACAACQKEFPPKKEESVVAHIVSAHGQVIDTALNFYFKNDFELYFENSVKVIDEIIGNMGISELLMHGLIQQKKRKRKQSEEWHAIQCPNCPIYIANHEVNKLKYAFREHLFMEATKRPGKFKEWFDSIRVNRYCCFSDCTLGFNASSYVSIRRHLLSSHINENDEKDILTCGDQTFEHYFDTRKIQDVIYDTQKKRK